MKKIKLIKAHNVESQPREPDDEVSVPDALANLLCDVLKVAVIAKPKKKPGKAK